METRYPKSRIAATFFGMWAGLILLATICAYAEGATNSYASYSYGGFCWRDEFPAVSLAMALTWETLAFGGTLLMWFRPRLGYFLAGLGYQLYMTLSLVEFIASPWYSRDLDSSGWALRVFALPVWLFWLCVKDEPRAPKAC